MKIISLIAFSFFIFSVSYAQKTVKIRKENTLLYKGIEAKIDDWYIFKKGQTYYLCPLNLPEKEVIVWFEKRINSQNIYKGFLSETQYAILSFRKENDPTDVINFYCKQLEEKLELISTLDGNRYTFEPIVAE